METTFKTIDSGTVTSARGFVAGAVEAGIKGRNKLDLAILWSEKPCVAAGVFTTSAIRSAPVILSQKHLKDQRAQALVVNSGCANASTGDSGMADAMEMAKLVSEKLGLSVSNVLVASTGVIGVLLPMERIRTGIRQVALTRDGGHALARAMMTTDTMPKEIAISVESKVGEFTIGGVAKGSGMIHPNMATLLCFLTTDAVADAPFLQSALRKAVEVSFNMVTIDGDTSPSDTVVILANGLASTELINSRNGAPFQEALNRVCFRLAKCVARDGEGATKLIEVTVAGAASQLQARLAARAIASSTLFKAAIHGNDPNWGRIVAALGRSGVKLSERKLEVYLAEVCVMKHGSPVPFDKQALSSRLARDEVVVRLDLNLGRGQATAWGCDLSEEYVTINSAYTT